MVQALAWYFTDQSIDCIRQLDVGDVVGNTVGEFVGLVLGDTVVG